MLPYSSILFFRRQALVIFACLGFLNSFGQSSFDTHAARFTKAWYQQDYAAARIALDRMVGSDSMQTYRYVEEADELLLGIRPEFPEGKQNLSTGTLDTLCGIYNTAIDHDQEKSYTWLLKKAFLQLRHSEWAGDRLLKTVRQSFFSAPVACPATLIEVLADRELEALKANPKKQGQYLDFWRQFHQKMMLREAERPDLAPETASLFNRVYHESRSALMDCDRIWARYIGLLKAGKMQDRDYQSLLLLLSLQNCNESDLWAAAQRFLDERDPDAWYYRQGAGFAMNREEYDLSQKYLSKSIEKESIPSLKAADLVKMAYIWRLKGDLRQAEQSIEQAMDLNREWGRPYLLMAELIEDAAADCSGSSFEKKALYWLAIDYCLLARNVDPQVRDEANQMLFRFQAKAPGKEELQFRSLQNGDSYPLRCWKQMVTTVKVF